jgi:hypothetical protein
MKGYQFWSKKSIRLLITISNVVLDVRIQKSRLQEGREKIGGANTPTKNGGKSLLRPDDFRMKVSIAEKILLHS